MYFSLSEYKDRTKSFQAFSRADSNGFYVSLLEQFLHKAISLSWKIFYRPRVVDSSDRDKPLFAVPCPLKPEHVANCKLYSDRYSLIQSLEQDKAWAEVGTFEGAFARRILETCKPLELHLIDINFSRVRKARNVEESDIVKFCQGDSAVCLQAFPDAYFDYIYIDANHDLFAVARDADAARSKLKKNGLLLFNDYIVYSHVDQEPYGVVQVVNSLCNEDGWEMVGLALQSKMYCDVALRRRPTRS